jgi:hypothetical protein
VVASVLLPVALLTGGTAALALTPTPPPGVDPPPAAVPAGSRQAASTPAAIQATETPADSSRTAASPPRAVGRPAGNPVALRVINLPGAPLVVETASAETDRQRPGAGMRDATVTVHNRGSEPVREFVVGFIYRGRVTAAVHTRAVIEPGARYSLSLRGQGTIAADPGATTVALVQARTGRDSLWGTPDEPGRLPDLPAGMGPLLRR